MRRGIPKHLGDEIGLVYDRFIQAPFDSTYDHRPTHRCKSDTLSYISPANPKLVGVTWLDATLDIRRNPSCTRVSNPTLRPTAPSTFSLPLLMA